MREIKFRAWDTYNKKMIPTEGGFYIGSADSEMMGGDDYPIMQYTGLKDKNGKEIYEGDILQVNIGGVKKYNVLVEWDGNGFWLEHPSGGKHFPLKDYLEIMGNIYENPELLEEK